MTIERGTPADVLMENAGRRVVEVIEREFPPLSRQRVAVFCGKGNNGGDGKVVARLLRDRVAALQVISVEVPEKTAFEATLVVDAVLGTGLKGPASGIALDFMRRIDSYRPAAKVIAVDVPSGLGGGGEFVHADITVTFTAPKVEHFLADGAAEAVGRLIVADIGSPPELVQSDLEVSEAHDFAELFAPRKPDSHKGDFGHVLVIGGAPGRVGAAAMAGLSRVTIRRGISDGGVFRFVPPGS